MTSPDAERIDAILERVQTLVALMNQAHRASELSLELHARADGERVHDAKSGPCEPCDAERLTDTSEYPPFAPQVS